jgi:hypothetical protein
VSGQNFSNRFREALWETHGKKCFHCSRELLLVDMQVDHIIPEDLHHGDAETREDILTKLGLPVSFNILGNGNMAPSCARCNSGKSDSVLIGNTVAVALTRLDRSLPSLEERLQKGAKARGLEDILRAVARSVDSGKFTRQEFQKQFDKIVFDDDRNSEIKNFNFETGKIFNKSLPLGFTQRARQQMEERRFLPSDIGQAVLVGLAHGDADASKMSDDTYRVRAPENLRIVFRIFGSTVVVLSVFEHA